MDKKIVFNVIAGLSLMLSVFESSCAMSKVRQLARGVAPVVRKMSTESGNSTYRGFFSRFGYTGKAVACIAPWVICGGMVYLEENAQEEAKKNKNRHLVEEARRDMIRATSMAFYSKLLSFRNAVGVEKNRLAQELKEMANEECYSEMPVEVLGTECKWDRIDNLEGTEYFKRALKDGEISGTNSCLCEISLLEFAKQSGVDQETLENLVK